MFKNLAVFGIVMYCVGWFCAVAGIIYAGIWFVREIMKVNGI